MCKILDRDGLSAIRAILSRMCLRWVFPAHEPLSRHLNLADQLHHIAALGSSDGHSWSEGADGQHRASLERPSNSMLVTVVPRHVSQYVCGRLEAQAKAGCHQWVGLLAQNSCCPLCVALHAIHCLACKWCIWGCSLFSFRCRWKRDTIII